ncbi:WD40-repeat-containing domain protein [Syncephalis pseudoplumigaleata]|uniref:WD40-repeat-containing domain protein n=1 Tax=Syncephalis pseudoplumigaleata TaxID=1712513 RepID=A0A4P9Z3W7_9FUNG|nr:WD40-repeat-containing domain protein [Syncephalis pseudoplumigaleata]|eukprot:RKP26732.1 WD40-repeat-containing domain protein [Syncephalis pseudoplumigaleata]
MNQAKDFEVSQPPSDGIADMSFSPTADLLAVASWDNQMRIYEVQPTGTTIGKAMYSHEGPVLCCAWSKDGSKLASAGGDKTARLYDLQSSQSQQIAQHDAPIRSMRWVDTAGQPILATGGWDKMLKYWDCRQPNPVASVQLPERCYTMDALFPLLVVGCADRHIQIFNLNSPTTPFKSLQSPLKWQTRCVSCFPTGNGFAVGSIEGRVAIQYVEEKDAVNNFSFKCHRDNSQVYAVNAISFHPVHGTFSTAGSDGTFNFWDKDSKQRLKMFNNVGAPIPCTTFNRNGAIFAYAVSYDWSKGHQRAPTTDKQQIFLHAVKEEDVKPRAPKKR